MTGSLKWYSPEKGYGFIEPDVEVDGGGDVFVRFAAVQIGTLRLLEEGCRLSFDLVPGERSWQAANVALVSRASVG